MTVNFSLYLITDRRATRGRPLPDVVGAAVQAGACAVQLREKDLPTRELLALARLVRERTAPAHVPLLINDRLDLCWAVEADGVHLRGDSLPTAVARRLLGPGKIIGVSVHSLDEALRAEQEGADFALFGPVHATPSKVEYGPPLGVDALAIVTRRVRMPVFAVGGVTVGRVPELVRAGARGVGVITAVLGADDVPAAAAAFARALTRSREK
jgi:thiamine-phosphate pyrophosphorylase